MADELQPDDLQALLQSVEDDTTTTSPNRDQIRRSVLTAFDDAPAWPAPDDAGEAPLISLDGAPRRSVSSSRVIGWAAAAAAVILAVVVVSQGPWQLDTVGPTNPETLGERRLSVAGPDEAAVLEPGPQTTDVIAGGLSFDAPAGLLVVEEADGLVVLAAADESDSSGQLVIVEVPASDWERELADLADAGEVNLKEVGVTVGGEPATRWDVTITNSAIAERSCTIGEPCIRLTGWPATGPASLWAGADNRVVELGRSDSSVVLAIEVSQRFTGSLSRLATQVINTTTVQVD
jgi:hypothetical protein